MKLVEAISVIDVLAESGDDRERSAWNLVRAVAVEECRPRVVDPVRLDRVAWGDGSAEHDE